MGNLIARVYHYSYDSHSMGVFQVGPSVAVQKPVFTNLGVVVFWNVAVERLLISKWDN